MPKVRTALISVHNKTGVVKFAQRLSELGVALISTGGTAALLKKNNIACQLVEEVTNFPECLDGRVKTLHPNIFMEYWHFETRTIILNHYQSIIYRV